MKLIVLTRYDELGASSRVRFYQMETYLKSGFDEIVFSPLINRTQLLRLYQGKKYAVIPLIYAYIKRMLLVLFLKTDSILFIEKELLPNMPARLELFLLRKKKYVLDYDDSIFHNYDLHPSKLIRKLLGTKIDVLMRSSQMVFCGSHYLLERANASGSKNNYLLPTVIQFSKYEKASHLKSTTIPVIVWIGTPQTIKYVYLIQDVLKELAVKRDFVLRIIGGSPSFKIEGVNVEIVKWSAEKEAELIAGADIGIMPLEDTPWEKGKCGYKLIQYMACGLPVVGAAIGENNFIIDDTCGFAVLTKKEWSNSLMNLLDDEYLRMEMGGKGKMKVIELYTEEVVGPRISALLNKIKNLICVE